MTVWSHGLRPAAPLGELWSRHCSDVDKARAIHEGPGEVTARRRGTAVVPSLFEDNSSTRVSWQGTCVASVEEMLPSSNGPLPTECLADAKLSEQPPPYSPRARRMNRARAGLSLATGRS